ncbi:MAG: insulinase family protein [Alphaproteobacteria bacterium]|nr:insulinase family protein [Alphaproteobacteria bacterium]
MRSPLSSAALRLVLVVLSLWLGTVSARAFTVQEVTSPGGIKAWLVEEHSIPLMALNFSFRSGATSDPQGRAGLANFLSGMLDEGAEDIDSATFQKRRDELAFRMSFDAGRDFFEGAFQTLTRNRDPSVELLRKAITAPRFDAAPLDRVRQQILVGLQAKADDPQRIASTAWMALALGDDPYAADTDGTAATVAAITAEDLQAAHARIFDRGTLQVSAVGDISAAELGPMLDRIFGGLARGDPQPGRPIIAGFTTRPGLKVVPRDIPQSVIVFGHEGPLRDDPAFIPAFVMSEILGGSFEAWLTREIREKRGLTYGVSAGLSPLRRLGLFVGSLSTRNEKAAEAFDLVKSTMRRMVEEGPSQKELDDAKTFLTGSYALRFTSSMAIAGQLLGLQQQGLAHDYIARRNDLIAAVTLDQVQAEAKRLLHPDRLTVTVVGRPEGLQ